VNIAVCDEIIAGWVICFEEAQRIDDLDQLGVEAA
jgi:hypothetical protein